MAADTPLPPADDSLLRVSEALAIPRSELEYRATRAGGPGGQHVNTSSTRIELTWNVRTSSALSDLQRTRLLETLASRLDSAGNLRIVSAASRSQHQNREAADERLVRALGAALRERKARQATRAPRAAKEARIRQKKLRGEVKKQRGRITGED